MRGEYLYWWNWKNFSKHSNNKILKNKFRTVFIKKRYLDQLDERKMLQAHGKLISD